MAGSALLVPEGWWVGGKAVVLPEVAARVRRDSHGTRDLASGDGPGEGWGTVETPVVRGSGTHQQATRQQGRRGLCRDPSIRPSVIETTLAAANVSRGISVVAGGFLRRRTTLVALTAPAISAVLPKQRYRYVVTGWTRGAEYRAEAQHDQSKCFTWQHAKCLYVRRKCAEVLHRVPKYVLSDGQPTC